MNQFLTTSFVLAALATFAAAQKNEAPVQKGNAPGHYNPPFATLVVLAGGSDDCANAAAGDAIAGFGTFAVNTGGAITGVSPQPVGGTTIKNDVWFYWTSPITGDVSLATCSATTVDTKAAAWAANNGTSCPSGTELAYNDDACNFQTRIVFPAVAGQNYFLQLGSYTEGVTYSATFEISAAAPPANDDCATPTAISGSGVRPFNNIFATTGVQGQAEALCLYATSTAIYKDSWWTWTPSASGSVEVSTCGQVVGGTDTRIAIYDGSGCPAAAAIACNDDAGSACSSQGLASIVTFNAVCGQTYTIQIGNYSAAASLSGTFTITESGATCGPPATPMCFGDGTGTACPCGNSGTSGNGCANSLNPAGSNLSSSGTANVSGDTLTLLGTGMPNSSALYFQGSAASGAGAGVVFGDGLRCAAGSVIRLGTKANVGGASQYPDVGDQSISVRGLNTAGAFRVYQCWYRNAAAYCTVSTFNLTNGVSVTWGP